MIRQSYVPLLLAALAFLLASCGATTNDSTGGGHTPGLTSVIGPVVGYPYAGAATVQAFAPNDGAQLVSGTLFPSPSSRIEGSLTPVANIPASSFVNPFFCNNAVVTPSSMQTTGVLLLGVADSGGVFGAVIRATAADPFLGDLQAGDMIYGYIAATVAGSVTGSCVFDGINATYDIGLSSGWNYLSARIDAVDSFGNPTAITYSNASPTSSSYWVYGEGIVTASSDKARGVIAIRKGLPFLN